MEEFFLSMRSRAKPSSSGVTARPEAHRLGYSSRRRALAGDVPPGATPGSRLRPAPLGAPSPSSKSHSRTAWLAPPVCRSASIWARCAPIASWPVPAAAIVCQDHSVPRSRSRSNLITTRSRSGSGASSILASSGRASRQGARRRGRTCHSSLNANNPWSDLPTGLHYAFYEEYNPTESRSRSRPTHTRLAQSPPSSRARRDRTEISQR